MVLHLSLVQLQCILDGDLVRRLLFIMILMTKHSYFNIKIFDITTQRSAITMLAFFFSSSKIGAHNDKPANRNWKQVFCNSLIGTILGICYQLQLNTFEPYPFLSKPYLSTFYLGGFLSFYACTTGTCYSFHDMRFMH